MSHLLISQKKRDQICLMLESLKPEFGAVGSRDVEVRMRRDDVDLIISTLAALTQPASPALKLPDGWVAVPRKLTRAMSEIYHNEKCVYGSAQELHDALLDAAAPDVPHTALIEPKCATGGAEWVKVSERMPEDLQDVLVTDGVEVQKCWYDGEFWNGPLVVGGVETHWMPLPAAPKP